MRPAIGFKTSELLNMPWTPKFKYVELVLNGEYLRNYQLVESVKEGENRVNIDESGYLIEIDDSYYHREPVYFTTSTKNHFYSYKYPDYENITANINDYSA